MLQNFDADLLRTNGLYWLQSCNCFFALEASAVKSCVSYNFDILHSFFHHWLSFQCCHQALKINSQCSNADQFAQPSSKSRTVQAKASAVAIT